MAKIDMPVDGKAVACAFAQLDYVKAVVPIGAPANPQRVQHLFDGSFEGLNPEDPVDVNIGGRSFRLKSNLWMISIQRTCLLFSKN